MATKTADGYEMENDGSANVEPSDRSIVTRQTDSNLEFERDIANATTRAHNLSNTDGTLHQKQGASPPPSQAQQTQTQPQMPTPTIKGSAPTIPLYDFDVRLEADYKKRQWRITPFVPAAYHNLKPKLDRWFPSRSICTSKQPMRPGSCIIEKEPVDAEMRVRSPHSKQYICTSGYQNDSQGVVSSTRNNHRPQLDADSSDHADRVHLEVDFVPTTIEAADMGILGSYKTDPLQAYSVVALAPPNHPASQDEDDDRLTLGYLIPSAFKDRHHPLPHMDSCLLTKEWIQLYGEVTLLHPFLPPEEEIIGPDAAHPWGRDLSCSSNVGSPTVTHETDDGHLPYVPTTRLLGILSVQVGLEPSALQYGLGDDAADGFIDSNLDLKNTSAAGSFGLARALKQALPVIVDWESGFLQIDHDRNDYWDRNESFYDLPPKQHTLAKHKRLPHVEPADSLSQPSAKRKKIASSRRHASSSRRHTSSSGRHGSIRHDQDGSPPLATIKPKTASMPLGEVITDAEILGDPTKETFLPLDTNIASLLEACRPPSDAPIAYPPTDMITAPVHTYQAQCLAWMIKRETNTDEDMCHLMPNWIPLKTKAGREVCRKRKQLEIGREAYLESLFTGKAISSKKLNDQLSMLEDLCSQDAAVSSPMQLEALQLSREPFVDPVNVSFYFDQVSGMPSLRSFTCRRLEPGGALCEAMGLGKTLESLALIATHPRPDHPDLLSYDVSRSARLIMQMDVENRPIVSQATLVVCPAALVEQWMDEIHKHFRSRQCWSDSAGSSQPGVVRYTHSDFLWDAETPRAAVREMAKERLTKPDIVVATYEELAFQLAESHKVQRLQGVVRTPLLEVLFWRILLDEAQIVAGASSKATEMVHELWRSNCWLVTGTPVTKGIRDIQGIFAFLDHDPFAAPRFFREVLQEPFVRAEVEGIRRMRSILPRFVWRHTKAHVENQLKLPPSTSEILEINLRSVERLFYDKEVKRHRKIYARKAGAGMNRVAQPDFLVDLRQLLSHPQIADQLKYGYGISRLSFAELFRQFCRQAETELETHRLHIVSSILQLVWGHDFYKAEKSKRHWTGGKPVLNDGSLREVLRLGLSITNQALSDREARRQLLENDVNGKKDATGASEEQANHSQTHEGEKVETSATDAEKIHSNADQTWYGGDSGGRVSLNWEEAQYWLRILSHQHRERTDAVAEFALPQQPNGKWDPERPTRTFFEKAFKNVNDKGVDLNDPRFHLVVQDASTENMDQDELMAEIEAERKMRDEAASSLSSFESTSTLDSAVADTLDTSIKRKRKKDIKIAPGLLKKSRLRGNASQRKQMRVWYYKPKERLGLTLARLEHAKQVLQTKEHETAFLREKLLEVQRGDVQDDPNPKSKSLTTAVECLICFDVKDHIGIIPCYHTFCMDCIEKICADSRQRIGTCPSCRSRFKLDQITRVLQDERGNNKNSAADNNTNSVADDYTDVIGDWGSKISGLISDIRARLKVDSTQKAVIFSHWKKMLTFIRDALVQNSIPTVVFGAGEASQAEALRAIRDDKDVRVILVPFLASAGAAGLTLTSCNLAYLMEPALDVALEAQAIGRINRIGQKRATTVIRVKMKDTIEEVVMRIADERSRKGMEQVAHSMPVPSVREGAWDLTEGECSADTVVEPAPAVPTTTADSSLRVRSIISSLGASVGVARSTGNSSLTMQEVALILGFDIDEEKRRVLERRNGTYFDED